MAQFQDLVPPASLTTSIIVIYIVTSCLVSTDTDIVLKFNIQVQQLPLRLLQVPEPPRRDGVGTFKFLVLKFSVLP